MSARAWVLESRTLLTPSAYRTDAVQQYDNPAEALRDWATELECSPGFYTPQGVHRLVVREVTAR